MVDAKMFFSSARERELIRRRRAAGEPTPWTEDPVFREWRFCNVRREDDKTTIWFNDNVRTHLKATSLPVIKATIAFRWFNRIETGERIKDLLLGRWDSEEARRRLRGVTPVVTGAYVIKTPDGMSKLDGVLWCIDEALSRVWHFGGRWWGGTLEEAWRDLLEFPYLGGFMAYEIVSDLRWTGVLGAATDINTWAHVGPGAARGLGWVLGEGPEFWNHHAKCDQDAMLAQMQQLLAMSRDPLYWSVEWHAWEMREVEHWLCEYDKYMRATNGKRLKRRFNADDSGKERAHGTAEGAAAPGAPRLFEG